jgi:hypothetical protein
MHLLQRYIIPLPTSEPNIRSQTNVQLNIPNVSLDGVKTSINFQTRRIRMSFNKSKRDNLFNQLAKDNNELRDLLNTSDRITALRQSRDVVKKMAETKGMWQFWRHADKLYKLLARSWLCECKQFHWASLLLQHRTSPNLDFRILFFFGDCSKAVKPSWTCQEARISMLEHARDDQKSKKRSAVNFVPDPIPPPSPHAPAATPLTTTPTPSRPPLTVLRGPSSTLSSSSKGGVKGGAEQVFEKAVCGQV